MRLWSKKSELPVVLVEWLVQVFPDTYTKNTWVEDGVTYMEGADGWGWMVYGGNQLIGGGSCATRGEALAAANQMLPQNPIPEEDPE